jgi:hypothetical protein
MAALLAFGAGESSTTEGAVRGTVRSTAGEPLPGVKILLAREGGKYRREIVTDRDGGYSLSRLPSGAYSLTAQAPGYRKIVRDTTVIPQKTVVLDLELTQRDEVFYPAKVVFRGMVSDPSAREREGQGSEFTDNLDFSGEYNSVYSLAKLLNEPEIYHDLCFREGSPVKGRPVIERIHPYQCEGPDNILESGTLAEIEGQNFESGRIMLNGKTIASLMSSPGQLVGRVEGKGSSIMQIVSPWGAASDPVKVLILQVTRQKLPPGELLPGETAEFILRIDGTSDPVPVLVALSSPCVSLAAGGRIGTLTSTGGRQNSLRVKLRANRAGTYEICYRLADPQVNHLP